MDAFYDNLSHKDYVITGNEGFVKSYDYVNNKTYHKYEDLKENNENNSFHTSLILNFSKDITQLIESSWDGNIRIWDFHSEDLINKINIGSDYSLQSICLWDNNHLFAEWEEKLKLIDVNEGNIKNIKEDTKDILTIKKIDHPVYGKSLIFQGVENNYIKLLFSDIG